MNPGDTNPQPGDVLAHTTAQRRPGRAPRRHLMRSSSSAWSRYCSAQRRPGREPRRHARTKPPRASQRRTLNEGRGVNPGDTRTTRPGRRSARPLNEGRGVNPGDTHARRMGPAANVGRSTKVAEVNPAQRRPGREPRRHRETAPVTPSASRAQRRPGREPRRHLLPVGRDGGSASQRSTKAGA